MIVWSFYRNQFQPVASGSKAVDILCVERDASWLIEIKDYRQHPRTKVIDIAGEVAGKVRDTLTGLASAAKKANEAHERQHARQAPANRRWRVVLHLEQLATSRRLRQMAIDPALVLLKLQNQEAEGNRRPSHHL